MQHEGSNRIISFILAVMLTITLVAGATFTASAADELTLTSDGVRNGRLLNEYGAHGTQKEGGIPTRSMPLSWSGAPAETKSYAILVDDITVVWTHWMAVNIKATDLPANASRSGAVSMVQGRNDFGTVGYGGPTPPSGTHTYDMTVFALDVESVSLYTGFSEDAYWDAIYDHIIDEVTISATYSSSYSADPQPPEPPVDPNMEYTLTLEAGANGTISLGASGTYLAGDKVDIGATPDEGYRFNSWTSSNGGTFGNANSATTTFTSPRGDTTVTASFVLAGSSGGSSGGGSSSRSSSSSGSSRSDAFGVTSTVTTSSRSSNVGTDGSVNAATIKTEVEAAVKASGTQAVVRTKNATSIAAATLKTMASAAGGKNLILHADTLSADNKAIQGRMYVDPAKLTGRTTDLKLGVYTESGKVSSVQTHFEKYFSNKCAVIKLEQAGTLSARLEVAAKVSLTGINTDNMVLYNYDASSNSYQRIPNAEAWVDSNGYLHFYTNQGGYIIVSNGTLNRK